MGCIPSQTNQKSNSDELEIRKAEPTGATASKSKVSVDLAISPDQFIVENLENIRKTYTFEKKLGEGNFPLIQRCLWRCI